VAGSPPVEVRREVGPIRGWEEEEVEVKFNQSKLGCYIILVKFEFWRFAPSNRYIDGTYISGGME